MKEIKIPSAFRKEEWMINNQTQGQKGYSKEGVSIYFYPNLELQGDQKFGLNRQFFRLK